MKLVFWVIFLARKPKLPAIILYDGTQRCDMHDSYQEFIIYIYLGEYPTPVLPLQNALRNNCATLCNISV